MEGLHTAFRLRDAAAMPPVPIQSEITGLGGGSARYALFEGKIPETYAVYPRQSLSDGQLMK
jgi:hypothetical protein